ncbi:MAG: DNA alkylation repair protein [Clostridia bacterium]|nr:DNA alkylation repair protein [Clostridia bacterium]
MKQREIQKEILSLADEKYKKFHSSLCPNTDNIMGVKVPILRNYAKKMYINENWKEYLNFKPVFYEEKVIQGMLIGFNTKENIAIIQDYIKDYIPKIDSWAVCDTFVAGLKITKKYPKEMWDFVQKYLKSEKEFELRFGIVMLLDYYITDQYIDQILQILNQIEHDGYYVKMAVAWAISVCYIKFPKKTYDYLCNNNLDDFTHNKSIQKIRESYRVTKQDKEALRKLRR